MNRSHNNLVTFDPRELTPPEAKEIMGETHTFKDLILNKYPPEKFIAAMEVAIAGLQMYRNNALRLRPRSQTDPITSK